MSVETEHPGNEYPDTAGYPDGTGTLDEGSASAAALTPAEEELNEPSTDRDDEIVVTADPSGKAYRAVLGTDEIAVMHVRPGDDNVVTITSTVVDPAVRDRGIGTAFIAYVLDELRDKGAHVNVECSMVEAFIASTPEYEDLRA